MKQNSGKQLAKKMLNAFYRQWPDFFAEQYREFIGQQQRSDESGSNASHDLSTGESDETGGSGDVRADILRLEKFKPLCYMQDQQFIFTA